MKVTILFYLIPAFIFFGFTNKQSFFQQVPGHADEVLDQTLFAKNESGFEWIIGLQINRIDNYFKGRADKVVYEIVVKNEGREIERTNRFTLDLGDYKLEDANGHFNSSQLYKLKYTATKYFEELEFKLAFREIHFDTGEVAKFDGEGKYSGR